MKTRTIQAYVRTDGTAGLLRVEPQIVEVFVRAPAAEQDAAQTRGASLMFCRWRDLELLAPYQTRVRRGWGVRW